MASVPKSDSLTSKIQILNHEPEEQLTANILKSLEDDDDADDGDGGLW